MPSAFGDIAVSAPCAALTAADQNQPDGADARRDMECARFGNDRPVFEQEAAVRLEQDALAVPQDAVGKGEALLHPPPGGGTGLIEPNRVHVSDFRRRVAPSGGLQLDAAVLAQNLPRRRLGLGRCVDKGIAHRQGIGAAGGVAGDVDHGLGVVVELEGQDG